MNAAEASNENLETLRIATPLKCPPSCGAIDRAAAGLRYDFYERRLTASNIVLFFDDVFSVSNSAELSVR
jgi:hypothetical protein